MKTLMGAFLGLAILAAAAPRAALAQDDSTRDSSFGDAIPQVKEILKKAAEFGKARETPRTAKQPQLFQLASYSEDVECEDEYTCRAGTADGNYCDVNSAHPVACFETEASVCRGDGGSRRYRHRTFVGCYTSAQACMNRFGSEMSNCCADQGTTSNVLYCRR